MNIYKLAKLLRKSGVPVRARTVSSKITIGSKTYEFCKDFLTDQDGNKIDLSKLTLNEIFEMGEN